MKHLLDTKVGPYQAMIPMVDVDTIGAGGGSIAYIDAGGIFRVGPRSAGADPGPAAYGRGGTEPTATDALVMLGWLRPELFLGGQHRACARISRARPSTSTSASTLGISIEEAAMGIYRILVHSMVDAIEQNSVRKGFDPRDFVLVAEGGAGPLFTADIAPEVGIRRVLVPSYPGITAALGLLDHRHGLRVPRDVVRDVLGSSTPTREARTRLEEQFAELEAQAAAQLEHDGVVARRRCVLAAHRRRALRGPGLRAARRRRRRRRSTTAWIDELKSRFHDIHEREYSRRFEDADVQLANIRVRAIGAMPDFDGAAASRSGARGRRRSGALQARGRRLVPRRRRAAEGADAVLRPRASCWRATSSKGPAIITQFDSTTVVPPGFTCTVDPVGHLVITYSDEILAAAQQHTTAGAAAR